MAASELPSLYSGLPLEQHLEHASLNLEILVLFVTNHDNKELTVVIPTNAIDGGQWERGEGIGVGDRSERTIVLDSPPFISERLHYIPLVFVGENNTMHIRRAGNAGSVDISGLAGLCKDAQQSCLISGVTSAIENGVSSF